MDDAKGLCSEWQSLLSEFRDVFTLGGWARFAQWTTGTVLCSEEHTITQILTGLGLEAQWRNVEHFAEYGSWDREAVEQRARCSRSTTRINCRSTASRSHDPYSAKCSTFRHWASQAESCEDLGDRMFLGTQQVPVVHYGQTVTNRRR